MKQFLMLALATVSLQTGFAEESPGSKLATEFRKSDANGDGRLSASEAPRLARILNRADADQSGDVTLAELAIFFRQRRRDTEPNPDGLLPPTKVAENFPQDCTATPGNCRRAAEYSDNSNGHAVVVMHRGKTVFEHYANGWSADKAHRLASGTKSFSGAMLAAAVKDELLTLDEPIAQTITEWQDDEKLSRITLRQLLSLTSGLDPGQVGQVPSYETAIQQATALHPAGTKFAYGPAPFQIFGEVIKRKTGADPLDFLKKTIFDPIDMKIYNWRGDENGNSLLPSGVHLQATEWIKFGEFLRTDNGKVLDEDAFKACISGSEANPRYGLTFWLSDAGYQASGAGKQRLYLLPEHELVVVRFGETKGRKFSDEQFLKILLKKADR